MKKSKIAVIGLKGLPAFGGAAAVGENIINQLCNDFDFIVYSVSSHTSYQNNKSNIYKQIVFRAFPLKKLSILFYYIKSALHCVLLARYHLIHLHHRDAAFIVPFLRLKYKVILTTHGMELTEKWKKYEAFFRLQDKLFLNSLNKVTCVSKKDLQIVNQFRKSNSILIPNGINSTVDRKIDFAQKSKITFAAGRIVPSKGCHILLDALDKISYTGQLSISGDYKQMGDYLGDLKNRIKNIDVVWTGLIKDKEKLFSIIRESDIFIFPSSIESMSMMLLEAASLGVPIIASDIKENMDIFDSTEVLYFRTNDADDLAKKINWALVHYGEMIEKANRAVEKLESTYNWRNIAHEYKKVYSSLIDE